MSRRSPDSIDRKIVALLKRNARTTATAIGDEVGLSRGAVHQRIQRLERDRIITGYTALTARPDDDELVTAIVLVNLVAHHYADVAGELAGWPEVRSCWSIAGDHDMALVVELGTNSELMEITRRLNDIDAVKDTATHIALMTHFDRPAPS